jgi:hypothetical protein
VVCPCPNPCSSVKHNARPERPRALHIPAGARASVDHRVLRGEATPEEVVHFLVTADADPTLVGLAHTLLGALGAASELRDLGASDVSVGFAMNLAERLARVLTSEVDKLDFEEAAGKEATG